MNDTMAHISDSVENLHFSSIEFILSILDFLRKEPMGIWFVISIVFLNVEWWTTLKCTEDGNLHSDSNFNEYGTINPLKSLEGKIDLRNLR